MKSVFFGNKGCLSLVCPSFQLLSSHMFAIRGTMYRYVVPRTCAWLYGQMHTWCWHSRNDCSKLEAHRSVHARPPARTAHNPRPAPAPAPAPARPHREAKKDSLAGRGCREACARARTTQHAHARRGGGGGVRGTTSDTQYYYGVIP